MKVVLISFAFREYVIPLANGVAREAMTLFMLPEEDVQMRPNEIDRAVNLYAFRKPRLRQPLHQMRLMRSLVRRIKDFQPDVIHLQGGHLWFNLVALPLLWHYPFVVTVHDPRRHVGDRDSHRTPLWIRDIGYNHANQVIVHSERMKPLAIAELGIPAERIHVIPLIVVDDAVMHRSRMNGHADAAHLKISSEHPEALDVLFFGRIWEYKGLEYLIRAEPLITAQVPEARIVIAGEGEDFTRYRQMMVHPERFVVHNEYVSDQRRAELFDQASVVALPYIDASQSGVIPIAYTFGKPVVATTVGGLPDTVDDGKTGFLVPPRDERALADAIVRLLKDEPLCRQLGANARRRIETESAVDAVAQQTMAVYRCAIDFGWVRS